MGDRTVSQKRKGRDRNWELYKAVATSQGNAKYMYLVKHINTIPVHEC